MRLPFRSKLKNISRTNLIPILTILNEFWISIKKKKEMREPKIFLIIKPIIKEQRKYKKIKLIL